MMLTMFLQHKQIFWTFNLLFTYIHVHVAVHLLSAGFKDVITITGSGDELLFSLDSVKSRRFKEVLCCFRSGSSTTFFWSILNVEAKWSKLEYTWSCSTAGKNLQLSKAQYYFLSRDGANSKWPSVHKVEEQVPEKQSRGVQKAYRLHPVTILLLNLLYKFL